LTTRWNPKEDGITHINVYSKGKTDVGRWASNFQDAAFIHPRHGAFTSVEGLWYWLSVPYGVSERDHLRNLSGVGAKNIGRQLRGKDWVQDPSFEADIRAALRAKYQAYPDQLRALQATTLPLAHYYVMYGKVRAVSEIDSGWILEELDNIRKGVL
jgi:hypothetical protein